LLDRYRDSCAATSTTSCSSSSKSVPGRKISPTRWPAPSAPGNRESSVRRSTYGEARLVTSVEVSHDGAELPGIRRHDGYDHVKGPLSGRNAGDRGSRHYLGIMVYELTEPLKAVQGLDLQPRAADRGRRRSARRRLHGGQRNPARAELAP